jgi:hypothetical protein
MKDVLKTIVAKAVEDHKPPEVVSIHTAADEIARALNIPNEAATMLLLGLCATGDVRWVDGSGQIVDEDVVTIAAFRGKPVFVAADDVRHHLVEWSPQPQPTKRQEVIKVLLAEGLNPPRNIAWKSFCDRVREECNGWRKPGKPAWGFSDKQIQRLFKELSAE